MWITLESIAIVTKLKILISEHWCLFICLRSLISFQQSFVVFSVHIFHCYSLDAIVKWNFFQFLVLNVHCSCIETKVIVEVMLYPATLLNLLAVMFFSLCIYVDSLWYSAKRDSFTSSFPIWINFIYFFLSIFLVQY